MTTLPNEGAASRAYYRKNAQGIREGWALANAKQIGFFCPEVFTTYFRAMGNMLCALDLLELCEAADNDDILEEFGNRRLRNTVQLIDLDRLREEFYQSETTLHELTRIEEFLKAARLERSYGQTKAVSADLIAACYHFAREYAYNMYARGAFDMLEYTNRGGLIPDVSLPSPKQVTP